MTDLAVSMVAGLLARLKLQEMAEQLNGQGRWLNASWRSIRPISMGIVPKYPSDLSTDVIGLAARGAKRPVEIAQTVNKGSSPLRRNCHGTLHQHHGIKPCHTKLCQTSLDPMSGTPIDQSKLPRQSTKLDEL